jgi:hypothetical protein
VSTSRPAPILADTFSLCEWLLTGFRNQSEVLVSRIRRHSLALLECLTLALKNRSREDRLDEADELLILLRIELRLAAACELLDDRQLIYGLDLADRIGRQLGGWQRQLHGS